MMVMEKFKWKIVAVTGLTIKNKEKNNV